MNRPATRFYDFGSFRVDTADCRLFRDGVEVPLAPKVFETLLVLLEKPGQLVGKDELIERLWPETFVGEDALAQKISLLRKALDGGNGSTGYIATVPKLGYRFVGAVNDHALNAAGIQLPNAVQKVASASGSPAAEKSRNRWLMSGVAFAILLCGLAVTWFFVWRSSTLWAKNFRITKLDLSNIAVLGVISPSGKYVAYVTEDKNGNGIWVRQIASGGPGLQILAAIPGVVRDLSYSPNEEYLYYTVGDTMSTSWTLYRINSLGGTPQRLVDGMIQPARFDPTGQRMVYVHPNRFPLPEWSEVVVSRLDGTDARPIARSPRFSLFNDPQWSTSDRIVFRECRLNQAGAGECYLDEIPASGGKETRIFGPISPVIDKFETLDRSEFAAIALDPQSGKLQVWILNRNGRMQRVTNDTNRYISLSIAQNARKLLATRFETEDSMWVADAPQMTAQPIGSLHAREISVPHVNFDEPAWTPDGNIIYHSQSTGNNSDLWLVHSDSSGQKQLTSSGVHNEHGRVSPDGKFVVFASYRNHKSRIWRVDIDGSNPRQLTQPLIEGGTDIAADVSPDGKWVAYKTAILSVWPQQFSIWKVPSGGGVPIKIADATLSLIETSLLFSPDGKWIAFQHVSAADHKKRWGIFSFENGSLLRDLDLLEDCRSIYWSRDGKSLIYLSQVGNTMELISQPIAGQPPKMILDFGVPDVQFVDWSKDGRKIVFVRKTEKHDLVLIDETH